MSEEKKPAVRPLVLDKSDHETKGQAAARYVTRPEVLATISYSRLVADMPELNLTALMGRLEEHSKAVASGDLSCGEQMLTAQAFTLDAPFHELTQRAMKCQDIRNLETYFKLAFQAQSKSRCCWDTMGELKNPRTLASGSVLSCLGESASNCVRNLLGAYA